MQSRIVNDRNARVPVIFEKKRSSLCILQIDLHKAVDEREAKSDMLQLFANSTSAQKLLHTRRNTEQLVQGKCGKTHIQKLVSAVLGQVAAQVSPFPCSLEKLRVDDRLILLSCMMSQDAGHGQFTVQHAGLESHRVLAHPRAPSIHIFSSCTLGYALQ